MRWRLFKLDWRYGLGELVIVVAGVLIALAVDQWNTARSNRTEAAQVVERLITDLRGDLDWLDFESDMVTSKEASLERIREVLRTPGTSPRNPTEFLEDVINGAEFGWNQVRGRVTTYNELIGSGRLSLIEDADLRVRIAEYYDALEDRFRRIDERETAFPYASYRLVPRLNEGVSIRGRYGREGATRLEEGLTPAEIDRLVARVLASDIGDHTDAEINLARFIRNTGAGVRSQCRMLIEQLEGYLMHL